MARNFSIAEKHYFYISVKISQTFINSSISCKAYTPTIELFQREYNSKSWNEVVLRQILHKITRLLFRKNGDARKFAPNDFEMQLTP